MGVQPGTNFLEEKGTEVDQLFLAKAADASEGGGGDGVFAGHLTQADVRKNDIGGDFPFVSELFAESAEVIEELMIVGAFILLANPALFLFLGPAGKLDFLARLQGGHPFGGDLDGIHFVGELAKKSEANELPTNFSPAFGRHLAPDTKGGKGFVTEAADLLGIAANQNIAR